MNLNFINQLDKIEFISSFENIFEESKFITEIAETKRPFRNKIHIIETFLMIFDNLEEDIKINIIKKHPDLADKVEINKGLSKLSDDEQSKSGLKDCTEDEFNMFQELNYSLKINSISLIFWLFETKIKMKLLKILKIDLIVMILKKKKKYQ